MVLVRSSSGVLAVLVHNPVHASWLNQVEIYFSIVQRKVLNPNDFLIWGQSKTGLGRFAEHDNATATSFRWRYTRTDLRRHLQRLDDHNGLLNAA